MADDRAAQSVFWVQPEKRAVLPLDGFHLAKSLRKVLRADRFVVTADRAFDRVIELCAESVLDRPTTWINQDIEEAFRRLHKLGMAHSIECWEAGKSGPRLVGGLYGLAMGRALLRREHVQPGGQCVEGRDGLARPRACGPGRFALLDCQFMTSHLASLGAVEVSADDYSALLDAALVPAPGEPPDWGALESLALLSAALPPAPGSALEATFTVSSPVSGQVIAQLITERS